MALVLATWTVVVLTAMLPLIFARQNRLAEADRAPRQIFGPAVAQFAASLAVLVTAALLGRHASGVASASSVSSNAKLLQFASASRPAGALGPRYTGIDRTSRCGGAHGKPYQPGSGGRAPERSPA